MSNIVQMGATLPPSRNLEALSRVEEFIRTQTAPAEIRTEHVLHGGMYTRTVRLLPGTLISGCLYKVPTMLIVNGEARVYVADGWTELSGYNVIAASAGRKQLFFAISEVEITMLFPTSARTVEEAENEMTDEADLLVSRQDGDDLITITGE
jgi:hypothetical protein